MGNLREEMEGILDEFDLTPEEKERNLKLLDELQEDIDVIKYAEKHIPTMVDLINKKDKEGLEAIEKELPEFVFGLALYKATKIVKKDLDIAN